RLVTTCLADVRPEPVRWLVPGYLARGKMVTWGGDGGQCKSTVTLHVTACLTTGRAALGLDYEPPPPADVLLVGCEDGYADTVVPRLLAAGADLGRVHRVDGIRHADGKPRPFGLDHLQAIEEELRARPGVRLIVIDPAASFTGRARIDDHKNAELRSVL